ncbi:hypothetical protein BJ085DRAFT_13641, partial [Dimargaris cristalligena]
NHDCNPNCAYFFIRRRAQLRALRPIAKGEEITISYVDPVDPTNWRQEKLLTNYYFDCRCKLCTSSQNEVGYTYNY